MLSGRGLCDASLVRSVVCPSVTEEPRTVGLGSLRLERERETETDRQTETERERDKLTERQRQSE